MLRVERGAHLGYVWHDAADPYIAGYYAQTSRLCFDLQAPVAGRTPRGLPLIARSAYGGDTTTAWDDYDLLPSAVTDPVGLATSVEYDYRVLKPNQITDSNMNVTQIGHTPLGLTAWIARLGKNGQNEGDTVEQPGQTFEYDLTAYDDSAATPLDRQPLSVTTTRRVDHRWTLVDQANAARAASGQPPLTTPRSLPCSVRTSRPSTSSRPSSSATAAAASCRHGSRPMILRFPMWGSRTISPQPLLLSRPCRPLQTARGSWSAAGRPMTTRGAPSSPMSRSSILASTTSQRRRFRSTVSPSTQQHYDPRGRPTVTVAPDGSQTRVVYGVPPSLTDPSVVAPIPWETYTYDANDNAGRSDPTAHP